MTLLTQMMSQFHSLSSLLYVVVGLVAVWYLKVRKRLPDNLPPFPVRPYPIVGHIPMLNAAGNPVKLLNEWRKKAGDIFTLYVGSNRLIVLNNLELMKEALVKQGEYFSDRPSFDVIAQKYLKTGGLAGDIFTLYVGSNRLIVLNNLELMKEALVKQGEYFSDRPSFDVIAQKYLKTGGLAGIIGNNGASWKEQRTVSMQILRQFGMGKNWLAEKVQEEIAEYLDTLSDSKGEPKNVRLLTNAAVSNVICAILVGQRFELEDPNFVKVLTLFNELVVLLANSRAVYAFPILRHVPGDLFGAKGILKNDQEFRDLFGDRFLREAKNNDDMSNFVRSYIDEMEKKQQTGTDTYLDERNLMRVMADLFAAGSETTSTTIMWALMFAMHHPDAQDKFYQEVVELVGTERAPSMLDKSKMNYVNAYIMETQRLGSIVPLSLLHFCTKTLEVGGYTIPAGTIIVPNLDEVLKDQKTWGDPLVFRPERFLDQDNKIIVPEHFIPFSIGRRYCMGEALARMELFLFITSIFQRFHILPEDLKTLPPLDPIFGITSAPKAFKVRLVGREG